MSADNGLVVAKLSNADFNNKYGVFHYFASNENEAEFTKERARQTFLDPVDAILSAFDRQRNEMTEYGVSVNQDVLEAAHDEYDHSDM